MKFYGFWLRCYLVMQINKKAQCISHIDKNVINVSSPLTLLLTLCTYIAYIPIHAYIIPIHIYIHTHAHTSIYIHVHTHITVHVYIIFHLLMEGGMVRVYRILRVMPQPALNLAKICFVTNYGKVRNLNF